MLVPYDCIKHLILGILSSAFQKLISAAARTKAWGLRPLACWGCGFECLSLVSFVCCQVEISASGRSLVKRSPTECGMSECDHEASIMRRPWPTRIGISELHSKI